MYILRHTMGDQIAREQTSANNLYYPSNAFKPYNEYKTTKHEM